jgi:GTP-binding protein
MRAASSDDTPDLPPPKLVTLESALEFIEDDELIEVTPQSVRIRKRKLSEEDRRRTKVTAEKS